MMEAGASFIAQPTPRRSRSYAAHVIDRIVAVCSVIPYALVALVLRLVMARAFFLSGQAMVVGPDIPLSIHGFEFSVILPAQLRGEVLNAFAAQFAAGPVSPAFIAYDFTYAEFLLPICLIIGFGTRIAALILLIVTIVLQVYVEPDAVWTTHMYWFSLLLVLMTRGAGAISLDRLIRHLYLK
jgi:putative oxidoreductase